MAPLHTNHRTSAAMAFVTTLGGLCVAQSGAPDSSPAIFRSGTDVVALDVAVEDETGRFVPHLTADEFVVLEDNVPQKLLYFSPGGRLPRAVVLLLDHSESMAGEKLARARAAAAAFLGTLDSHDLVEVLAFSDTPERLYPLGSDHSAAARSLAGLSAGGTTKLYDALLLALRDLERAKRDVHEVYQHAIVILSDGEDTQSRETFEDVLDDARRGPASIDAVSIRNGAHHEWLPPVHELTQLALDTGGRAVAIRRLSDLISVYEDIGSDLQRRYRLGYVSSSTVRDGRWRRISVRVLNNKKLVARTRAGYYAPRPEVPRTH
jgi:Ca-activated chloride channel family protein